MIGRVGWTTATIRESGNHSSRWTYRRGASERASSAVGSAPRAPATGRTRRDVRAWTAGRQTCKSRQLKR